MSSNNIRTIKPSGKIDFEVCVPPSKSYTNRALITASLAKGDSTIKNASESDDTKYLISALQKFGVKISKTESGLRINGMNGSPKPPEESVFIGSAGTSMRFLTTFSALAPGKTIISGDERMNKRPIQGLIHALSLSGVECFSSDGFPPIVVYGNEIRGGEITINSEISSQFISALLLVAPYARETMIINITGRIISAPYVDMTVHTMRAFGAVVMRPSPNIFIVDNHQHYFGNEFYVEGDASSATYFCAAAAITGGRVRINNLGAETLQGDIKFLDILSKMGCYITKSSNWIEVRGGTLQGQELNMRDIPDCVPTVAVTAAFAEKSTVIKNIPHLRYKESDRIEALATNLVKLGCEIETGNDWIKIIPKPLKGDAIETYNDHRIAMSFAIAGLKINGLQIENPDCVSKSFPTFWKEFEKMEGK